jgi:DNA end-binding protein Ku
VEKRFNGATFWHPNMSAIWKGTISFGLVTIPVSLNSAIRREEVKFRLLRKKDLSPISFKRVAAVDGEEVPATEIVKGFEYEQDHFVVMEEEDFQRPKAEGVHTIQLIDFVAAREIDPIFFDKPYYLAPEKAGARPYALLRDGLIESGTVGIAKVVIRGRQHLAALKPREKILVLELMHFKEEFVEPESVSVPKPELGKKEMEMAKALIGAMTTGWNPDKYTDDYKSALLEVIERKIKEGGKRGKRPAKLSQAMPGNVVNILDVLQKSLQETKKVGGTKAKGKKQRSAA